MPGAPRIFLSAGEPSGDRHAAEVARALRARWPDVTLEAFGGPALARAGATVRFPMETYTVLGFFEALAKLPAHFRLLRWVGADFRTGRYDLAVFVDYPGLNLRLAEAARRAGVKTLYYVAPQLWAWRRGRARRMRRTLDRLAVVLPFEPGFFASVGLDAQFVGHPLTERAWPTRDAARHALGIRQGQAVLAVLPGSRAQEINRIWPVFSAAARELRRQGSCDRVLVAGTPAGRYPRAGGLEVVRDDSALVLAAADAALVKSGTSTLEAAMTGTPMVVGYRVHPLTAAIARRVMTVRWISLVNLVAGREVVPELVQGGCRPETLQRHARPLLNPRSPEAEAQRQGLAEVRERLGTPGAAGRVAGMAAELLGR
jgi:lipid-A-disaccharide synthase